MRLTIFILFTFFASSVFSQELQQDTRCPLEIVELAIKSNSAKLLKEAYSKEILQSEPSIENWETALSLWRENLQLSFGAYNWDDFSCIIDIKNNKAVIFYKGKKCGVMKVINESGAWKFNER